MPQDIPISFCTSHGSSYKRSVPMLCPSNGDVLVTPLPTVPEPYEIHSIIQTLVYCFRKIVRRINSKAGVMVNPVS